MTNRTHILDVAGKQVQETVERLGDRVVRAIFVVEDTAVSHAQQAPGSNDDVEALMAEIDAHAVHAAGLDDSREAIYTRLEGE